jgi:ribose 1,5-bisphosphokinase PhnN
MSKTKIPKFRKSAKFLIRVSKKFKLLAEKLSSENGENTSEFFRRLAKEEVDNRNLSSNFTIIEQQKQVLKEIRNSITGEEK